MASIYDSLIPTRRAMFGFFNIFGDSLGQITYGSTIDSASIRLYGHGGNYTHSINLLNTSWSESGTTWNNFGSVPGGSEGVDWDTDNAVSFNLPSGYLTPVDIDVTSFLQSWADGEDNFGWMFTGVAATVLWGVIFYLGCIHFLSLNCATRIFPTTRFPRGRGWTLQSSKKSKMA